MKSTTKKPVTSSAPTATKQRSWSLLQIPYRWVHFLTILFIYVCCTCVLGDLFQRAQQDCYVSAEAERMTYILREPMGAYYWAMRFVMLVFKNVWLGGAVMTVLLVGSACCLSRLLGLSRRWKLLTFLLPLATLAYFAWRGLRLYFHDEPSLVMGIPFALFVVTAVGALVATCVRKRRASADSVPATAHWSAILVVLLAGASFFSYVHLYRQNDVVCAR